jgi:hypothetical protein
MEKMHLFATKFLIIVFYVLCLVYPSVCLSFSFSEYDDNEKKETKGEQLAEQQKIDQLMAIPCRHKLQGKKIALLVGAGQPVDRRKTEGASNYQILFQEINNRLQDVGLVTYSMDEITDLIAQAELDAFLANDIDSAAKAASKLKADFILRGDIQSDVRQNIISGVNEVSVSIVFTLVDESGLILSTVSAEGESYAGGNTLSTALTIVRAKARFVVAQLYNAYCQSMVR